MARPGVAWREPPNGCFSSLNLIAINHPRGDQRAAHQREQESYVMRKTSKQTTNTTGAAAHATSPAVAHEQLPSPPVIDNCAPSSWPWSPDDFSPIEWWRSLPADCLGDAQHLLLRATLDKISVMKGREWLSAMHGDAAASISIAVEMFPITEITLEVDLAM